MCVKIPHNLLPLHRRQTVGGHAERLQMLIRDRLDDVFHGDVDLLIAVQILRLDIVFAELAGYGLLSVRAELAAVDQAVQQIARMQQRLNADIDR